MNTSLISDAGSGAEVDKVKEALAALTEKVVAHTDVPLEVADPKTGLRMVRSNETNLGDLCADAYRALSGADIAFVNGGGIRSGIPAGGITYGQILAVHPFGNSLCLIEATGQEILDALEMSAASLPGEFGGFLQVSGISFTIDMHVKSTVTRDEHAMFTGVTGERRVKDVLVGDKPIDPEALYTVASHNYQLKNSGDGYCMFADNKLLLDSVMLDNQVLITYICDKLGGVIGEEYADPYGQGRITIIDVE